MAKPFEDIRDACDLVAQVEKGQLPNPEISTNARPTPSGTTGPGAFKDSKFAASPSTCGDELTGRHHRTVGEPGQGVDG
jgi:hypothetical protein